MLNILIARQPLVETLRGLVDGLERDKSTLIWGTARVGMRVGDVIFEMFEDTDTADGAFLRIFVVGHSNSQTRSAAMPFDQLIHSADVMIVSVIAGM